MSFHRDYLDAGTDTSDATALQHHIKNGKTAYIASGKVTGNGYFPGMMKFDGSTGYYSLTADFNLSAGFTFVSRFKWAGGTIAAAGGFSRVLAIAASATATKMDIAITNDETADSRAGRLTMFSQNAAFATLLTARSTEIVSGGAFHSILAAYNPSAGTAVIKIGNNTDQINAAALGHTITTGTMATGSGPNIIGARAVPDRFFNGDMNFCGLVGGYITDWSLFFHPDGSPKDIESTVSTVFGGPPILWHESAKLDENKGSGGNLTKNGGITLAAASNWS